MLTSSKNSSNYNFNDATKKGEDMKTVILAIGSITIIGLLGLYFFTFNGGLSKCTSAWGDFGGYFGGTGSLIALCISLYFALVTYNKEKNISKLSLLYIPAIKDINEIIACILYEYPATDEPKLIRALATKINLKSSQFLSSYTFILKDFAITETEYIDFLTKLKVFTDKSQKMPEDFMDGSQINIDEMQSNIDECMKVADFPLKIKNLITARIYSLWEKQI